jgi:photosystem II stability/assembly factor-like uncharacterized protein
VTVASWVALPAAQPQTPPAATGVVALSDQVLVVAAADGLWRSGDAGRRWQRTAAFGSPVVSAGLTRAGNGVVADVSLVSSDPSGRSNGELYFSRDGSSWRQVTPVVNGYGDNHSLAMLTVVFDGTGVDAHGLAFALNADPVLNSGPLLHSSDGGRHWQAAAGLGGDNAGVQAVAFVPGTRTAFAAVDPQQFHHCAASLARSDDGGTTWRPTVTGCSVQGISTLSFLDTRHGYAGGASLLVTTDAGRTWSTRQVSRPPGVPDSRYARLSFSSRSDATVLAGACDATRDPQNEPCLGEVWATTDGGRTWTDTHLAAHQVASSGSTLITAGGPSTPPGLSVSRDGGRSWSRVVAPGDIHIRQLTGPPNQLLALTNGLSAQSEDGGRTWQPAPAQVPSVHQVVAQAGAVALRTGNTSLQRSTDGGRTWTTVSLPGPNLGIPTGGIAFNRTNPTKVVALSLDASQHTHVLTSRDSGNTWTQVTTLPNTFSFDGMVSYDGHTIAFTAGRVEVSPDDGQHFTRYPVANGKYFLNSAGVAGTSVWVTGFVNNQLPITKVLVAHSEDGGRTWNQQLLTGMALDPYTEQLPDVLPLTGGQALLATNTGALLRTLDGGRTWHQEHPTLPVT